MVIYLHGFCSAGNGRKFESLKKALFASEEQDRDFPCLFLVNEFFSPNLPVSPKSAIKMLTEFIDKDSIVVGTSLGAFFSLYLSAKHPRLAGKTLALNPTANPSVKLRRVLGENTNYVTGETFLWTEEHLQELKELEDEMKDIQIDYDSSARIAIGIHDELTDEEEVKTFFKCNKVSKYEDGHRFDNCFEQAVEDAFWL